MRPLVVILAILTLVSCNRDPNVAKKRYLENGNKYFEKGKYKEASIMYRNALQKDQRYGPAYYHLALTDLKLGRVPNALGELRRAIELIPKDQQDHQDAQIRLAEVYLAFTRDEQFLKDVDAIVKELFQKDPNSLDGHRLTGDLDFVRAQSDYRAGQPDETQKLLESAVTEYRKAIAIKPNESLNMQLARAVAASRQYPEAEVLYKQLLEKNKNLIPAYNELYHIYLVENKTADAEQILKAGAANNPKQVNFLVQLATFYSTRERHDEMVGVLNQIKSRAKDFDHAWLLVGDFYFRNGDMDESLRQYKEGIAADPAQKATYQKRIIEVLMRQGKQAESADVNSAILRDNPKDSDARGLQASLMLDRGEVQRAISELQAVVSASPDNFVARFNLGRAHVLRGEWEQARQQFAESIRLRRDYLPSHLALGQLQIMLKEYDAALKSSDEIVQIDKRSVAARMIQAEALMGEKKYPEAKQLLESIRQANPNAPNITVSLGMVALDEGKYQEAEETFHKAWVENPKDPRGLVGMVETLVRQKKLDEAVQILQAEIAKAPGRNDFHMALGNVAVRAGNLDLALSEFQGVLKTLDKNANARMKGEVCLRIGEAYRIKGDMNAAVDALYQAKQALPDNQIVVNTLAHALSEAGRMPEAQKTYEQSVRINPRDAVALNNLAFLMAQTGGDLDQALAYAQRAKQLLPNLNEVADTMGWIYLKKNLSDNAMDIFQDLVTKTPNNPTYRFHLGMALAQKGDKPRALKELRQALQSNPQKDEEGKIRDLINKLQA